MYQLCFDGASKGNPGKGGAGSVLYDPSGTEIWSSAVFLGDRVTNNFAEYKGLLFGLQEAQRRSIRTLSVVGDSLLVIEQMKGKYKCKSDNLLPLWKEGKLLEETFEKVEYTHVLRHLNQRADQLSNDAFSAEGAH